MFRIKAIVLILLGILLIIGVFQNSGQVDIRFLFWNFPISLAVVLFLTTAVGFIFGLIVGTLVLKKPTKDKSKVTN